MQKLLQHSTQSLTEAVQGGQGGVSKSNTGYMQ